MNSKSKTIMNLTAVLVWLTFGIAYAQSSPFSLSARATQSTFEIGSDIQVVALLTNNSDTPVTIPGLNPLWTFVIEVKNENGDTLPEREMLRSLRAPRTDQGGGASAGGSLVNPGKAAVVYIPLSQYYDFSKTGVYTVALKCRVPKLSQEWLQASPVTIVVVP